MFRCKYCGKAGMFGLEQTDLIAEEQPTDAHGDCWWKALNGIDKALLVLKHHKVKSLHELTFHTEA